MVEGYPFLCLYYEYSDTEEYTLTDELLRSCAKCLASDHFIVYLRLGIVRLLLGKEVNEHRT